MNACSNDSQKDEAISNHHQFLIRLFLLISKPQVNESDDPHTQKNNPASYYFLSFRWSLENGKSKEVGGEDSASTSEHLVDWAVDEV